MHSFKLTRLLVLGAFILRAFSNPTLQFKKWEDGSYGWQTIDTTVGHMTADDIKNAAVASYEKMMSEAPVTLATNGLKRGGAPRVMVALYVPTQHVLVLASSIRGLAVTSQQTEFICGGDQHHHGNCAEMNALALLDADQIDCRNSLLAAYGLQRSGAVKFMSPCQDAKGGWGCGSFCAQNSIQSLTRRSRIEGIFARKLNDNSDNWTV